MNVVDFANDILDMHERIRILESENANLRNYRNLYNELLSSNIEHNQHMMKNLLEIAITPGVTEAMQAARAQS